MLGARETGSRGDGLGHIGCALGYLGPREPVLGIGKLQSCSQNQEILHGSFPDRGERYAGIESNQPALIPNRERKQINVGQLPRSMNPGRVNDVRIQQTDLIRPEFVDVVAAGLGQMCNDTLHRQRVGIAGIRHDANTSILRDRARRPAFPRMLREPIHR
jgi:hypothetical protein